MASTANGQPPVAPTGAEQRFSAEEMESRINRVKELRDRCMKEGEHYGMAPGGSRPTLFKPGAELLAAAFNLSPRTRVTHRCEDWENGFVSYEVKVTLVNKLTGVVEGESVGSCNSRERRYKNLDAAGCANTVLKMAKKRAQVDAVGGATMASVLFSVEEEDLPEGDHDREPTSSRQQQAPRRERPQEQRSVRDEPQVISASQKSTILGMGKKRAPDGVESQAWLNHLAGKPVAHLTRPEASRLISHLNTIEPVR